MNAAILLIASALTGAGEGDVQNAHQDRQPVRNVLRAGANVVRNRQPVRNVLRAGASVIRKGVNTVRNRKRQPVRNILRRVTRIRIGCRQATPAVRGTNAPTPQNE